MSTKTVSQMEAVLLDRIEKSKEKLIKLQHKNKLKIGTLAYKYGLHQYDPKVLDKALSKVMELLKNDNQ